jgi:hypothetical protein
MAVLPTLKMLINQAQLPVSQIQPKKLTSLKDKTSVLEMT